MIYIKILIIVLIIIFSGLSAQNKAAEFEKGTLVLLVPCDEGILVCADKRFYRPSTGVHDNFNKLIKVNDSSGYAVLGAVTAWRNNWKIFDVKEILNPILETSSITDNNYISDSIETSLKYEFSNSVLNTPFEFWPESQFPEKSHVLFEVIFFHYNNLKNPKLSKLKFRYIKELEPIIETVILPISINSSFSAYGSDKVIFELQNGNNFLFDFLRKDDRLKPILSNQVAPSQLKLDDAIYFCEQMIKSSNKMYSYVSDIDGRVGPTFDLLLIGKEGLFFLK